MPGEVTINVTEFKAKSLKLLDDLSRGEIGKITVTKRGKPVAVVSPAPGARSRFDEIYGSMRGSVFVPPGLDLTEPLLPDDWEDEWLADWDRQMK